TENPFFEVNKALVSRSRVFQLKPLTSQDLMNAAKQALADTERGYGHWKIEFEKGALEHLVETANGDARSLLNALELAVETTPEHWSPDSTPPVPSYGSTIYISKEACEESIQKKVVLYDRDGDYHYDIISAFIKSLRGRDPDAACYWLARMVKAGEDPHFIFRRMLISACEDTGLADPRAISIIESCAQAFDRVGMPEGQYFLAHAALYLSTAPKSNSAMAFFDALASVEKEDAEVPNHLRDNNRDAEGFGHGSGYMYPHAYRDHWVAQQYLPDALVGRVFYTPSTQGYEKEIRDEVLSRRELQISSLMQESQEEIPQAVNPVGEWWKDNHKEAGKGKTEENLTFTPQDKKKEAVLDRAERSWRSRLDTNKAELLTQIRDNLVQMANLKRHHRSLIWNADDALLLFYILRQCPEGLACGACRSEKGKQILEQYASTLGDMDKPLLAIEKPGSAFAPHAIRSVIQELGDIQLDRLFFRDPFASVGDIQQAAQAIRELATGTESTDRDIAFSENDMLQKDSIPLLSKDALTVITQRIPRHTQHISRLLIDDAKITGDDELSLIDKLEKAESEFFSNPENTLFSWDTKDIADLFGMQGFSVQCKTITLTEKRRISPVDIEKWFNTTQSSYGKHLTQALGEDGVARIKEMLLNASEKMLFNWKSENAFFTCRFDK
ncbi:MAG: recombinase RarA, partial [Treponema sp.]|nr:recombinase RarA [Treponema sp.]